MKLLILTQKVDKNDVILGFFHGWLKEFSKHTKKLTVICLEKGEYDLPDNVEVLSLGKEEGVLKLEYIFRFYKYIWQQKNNYDHVFVHMNQEYVLLGGLCWRFFGKRVFMWRNHPKGSFLTNLAVLLSNKVFATSLSSYVSKFKKSEIMPVGVDTERFKRNLSISKLSPNNILYVGRLDPIKKIDILIKALILLDEKGVDFNCSIHGPSNDNVYYGSLCDLGFSLINKNKLHFSEAISNEDIPQTYNKYSLSVNLTPQGSFDKTILEHMACEGIVLFSNNALEGQVDVADHELLKFEENDPVSLSEKLGNILNLGENTILSLGYRLREVVKEKHSLRLLIDKLVSKISNY